MEKADKSDLDRDDLLEPNGLNAPFNIGEHMNIRDELISPA